MVTQSTAFTNYFLTLASNGFAQNPQLKALVSTNPSANLYDNAARLTPEAGDEVRLAQINKLGEASLQQQEKEELVLVPRPSAIRLAAYQHQPVYAQLAAYLRLLHPAYQKIRDKYATLLADPEEVMRAGGMFVLKEAAKKNLSEKLDAQNISDADVTRFSAEMSRKPGTAPTPQLQLTHRLTVLSHVYSSKMRDPENSLVKSSLPHTKPLKTSRHLQAVSAASDTLPKDLRKLCGLGLVSKNLHKLPTELQILIMSNASNLTEWLNIRAQCSPEAVRMFSARVLGNNYKVKNASSDHLKFKELFDFEITSTKKLLKYQFRKVLLESTPVERKKIVFSHLNELGLVKGGLNKVSYYAKILAAKAIPIIIYVGLTLIAGAALVAATIIAYNITGIALGHVILLSVKISNVTHPILGCIAGLVGTTGLVFAMYKLIVYRDRLIDIADVKINQLFRNLQIRMKALGAKMEEKFLEKHLDDAAEAWANKILAEDKIRHAAQAK